ARPRTPRAAPQTQRTTPGGRRKATRPLGADRDVGAQTVEAPQPGVEDELGAQPLAVVDAPAGADDGLRGRLGGDHDLAHLPAVGGRLLRLRLAAARLVAERPPHV